MASSFSADLGVYVDRRRDGKSAAQFHNFL